MTARLEISIGPVQGFVTQSRRTRDLWASSYLLAFLSAHAMRGAAEAGAEIVQPEVKQDPLYLRVSGKAEADPPGFGTLPNHFVVQVNGGEERAKAVAQAAVQAFQAAWAQVCEAVWDRYLAPVHEGLGNGTQTIWNRQVGSFWEIMWAVGEPGALARRKHWRSHQPPPEPGDKCVLNHDLQELSGFLRSQNRPAQDKFWDSLELHNLDLREKERLSAIALVKRLFPLVSQKALGWQLEPKWPSTLDIGAGAEESDKPPFYAIVLADGDRLGKLLGTLDSGEVSRCLATFTSDVPEIVKQREGFLVYAGGDDVLAMLPTEQALACAQAIAEAYRNAFADTKARNRATLSAAVVFAHGKLPLGQVLREAHRQLDEVAKRENGRNSLSATVLKNSGAHCQWTTTWNRASSGEASEPAICQLERLSALLKASGDESGLSSTLIYRLRDLISRLCGWSRWEPGAWAELVPEIDLRAFLQAEIAHGFSTKTDSMATSLANAVDLVWRLMPGCRNETAASATPAPAREVGVDALMLAHFLANPDDNQ